MEESRTLRRVALLTNFIPPYRLPFLKALAKRTKDLCVFISTPMETNRAWTPRWDGLKVVVQHNLTFPYMWRHSHGFSEKLFVHIPYDTVYRLFRYRPDVVVSGEFGARTLQAAIYRLINPWCRLIIWATISEHTEKDRGIIRTALRRVLIRMADGIVVNGESGARYLHTFRMADDKIFRVPYSIDNSAFSFTSHTYGEVNPYRLLFTGQFVPRKGLIQFFSAMARFGHKYPDQQVEFWLVGDGPVRESLELFNLPHNISTRFLGKVTYEELPKIYSQASIYVFPSLADEWGVVVNEAMASGLPVLGSIYSQAVETLCEEGKTGWLFCPDDPDNMLEALERAMASTPEKLDQMRIHCVEKIKYLSPELLADRFREAIEAVCE